MKQTPFLKTCMCFLTLAVLTGCDLKFKKKGSNSDDSPAAEATRVVNYTNSIVDVMRSYTGAAESAISYYTDLEEYVAGSRSYQPSTPSSMNFLWTDKEKASSAFGDPVDGIGKDEQFFKDSLALYNRLFKTFKEQDSVLALYVKAEDYKDDAFAKGKTIIDKQNEIYPQLVRLRNSIETKIETVADAAEEISLKDSPILDAYKAAKGDLAKFKALANMIAEKETFSDADLATIDAKYNELTASIENNSHADKSKLNKENKTSQYTNFYQSITNQAAELKTIIREIKGNKKLTENEYNSLNNLYENVINAYNSWVG